MRTEWSGAVESESGSDAAGLEAFGFERGTSQEAVRQGQQGLMGCDSEG